MRTPNSGIAIGCVLLTALLSSMGAHAAAADSKGSVQAQPVRVVADTKAGARRQGTVNVGGINWACSGAHCRASTTSSAVAAPLAVCQGLAREVGAIRGFALANRPLNGSELQQCNRVVLAVASRKASPYPENWTEPDARADKSSAFEDLRNELRKNRQTALPPAKKPSASLQSAPPAETKAPTALGSRGYPVRIRTESPDELRVIGQRLARSRSYPVRVRTEGLSATGTGGTEARLPVTSIRIRTERLTVTGAGSDR